MNPNIRRAEQLGMPYGTATGRLRKMILFDLLKRHNENICFKCGESIQKIEDLSIEHKQPWENRDTALFWDLDNIAFSHIHCNRRIYVKKYTEEERREVSLQRYRDYKIKNYPPEKRHAQYLRTGK